MCILESYKINPFKEVVMKMEHQVMADLNQAGFNSRNKA